MPLIISSFIHAVIIEFINHELKTVTIGEKYAKKKEREKKRGELLETVKDLGEKFEPM